MVHSKGNNDAHKGEVQNLQADVSNSTLLPTAKEGKTKKTSKLATRPICLYTTKEGQEEGKDM